MREEDNEGLTDRPPIKNTRSVSIFFRLSMWRPKTMGMGMTNVTNSVAISVPTIAYPLGIALPQCSKYSVGDPNTAVR